MKRTVVCMLCILFCIAGISTALAVETDETPSGISVSNMEQTIDDFMDDHIGKSAPGAAVVVVKDGEIIFSKGYGYADTKNKIPVSAQTTVFEQGSISKLLVYTTIMRLSEQGKIDLEADIRSYLPEGFLKKTSYEQPITMLDIMNHTTGFEDYLFDVVLTSQEFVNTLEETLKKSQPRQVYAPGEVSAYSNYAVALAGYIAEQIIGQDFYAYVMDTIYEPLHMDSTTLHPLQEDRPEVLQSKAKGYVPLENGEFAEGGWGYVPLYPAGAMHGTAEDLARFAIALMPEDGQECALFEKRETLDKMLTNTYEKTPGLGGIAHGFFEWDCACRALGHDGGTATSTSQMNIVPEQRFGVVVLTNVRNENDITVGLTEALIGEACAVDAVNEGAMPNAEDVEGTYIGARRMHSGFLSFYGYLSLLEVVAEDDNTIVLRIGGDEITMVQTRPYMYSKIASDSAIMSHYFSNVYFDMREGGVHSMACGEIEYMPLPAGRTRPWVAASVITAVLTALYFIIAPIVLLICRVRCKERTKSGLLRIRSALVFSGTLLIANNAALIVRMLMNNYRSFVEMQIHIYLNYPLTVLAAVLTVLVIVKWKSEEWTKRQKTFTVITLVMLAALIAVLLYWKFMEVVA